jgi:hypothetical protein
VISENGAKAAAFAPALILSLGLLAFAAANTGCGTSSDDGADAGAAGSGGGSGAGATFSNIYAASAFQKCAGCHAPNAPGKVDGTESTENWSSRASAYASLKGKAMGLIGNFSGCNGVPFLAASADNSLLVAAFDADVRANFMNSDFPDCNADAISDQTLKLGSPLPDPLLQQLKDWVNAGAPDM